jgi:hypothetical protein
MKRFLFCVGILAAWGSFARADSLKMVINEWNCVSQSKFLGVDDPPGPNDGTDTYFGTVKGNGDDWIELAVVQDHLDIRGWSIAWSTSDKNGVYIDGGSLSFANSDVWKDLRQGTLIGLQDNDSDNDATGGVGAVTSDTSYNPFSGDWTILANIADANLISKTHWKINNDNWKGILRDASNQTVEDYVGENTSGAHYLTTGGINSQEVGALSNGPDSTELDYNVHVYSSFLSPNNGQDFTAMRSAVVPEPGTFAMLFCGLAAACGTARIRRRRSAA